MTAWPDDVMVWILVDWDLCKSKDMLKEPKARNGNQSVGFISYSSELSMLANHIMCREHGRLSLRFDYNTPKSLDIYLMISNLSYTSSPGTLFVITLTVYPPKSEDSANTSTHGFSMSNETTRVSILVANLNFRGYEMVTLPFR